VPDLNGGKKQWRYPNKNVKRIFTAVAKGTGRRGYGEKAGVFQKAELNSPPQKLKTGTTPISAKPTYVQLNQKEEGIA